MSAPPALGGRGEQLGAVAVIAHRSGIALTGG
jgi:hypothetical protein